MAKSEAETDESSDGAEPEAKGGKKKLILIVVVLLVALVAAKMVFLKPQPLSAAALAAKTKATDITLKELARHTMMGLAPPAARNRVQQQLSFDVCKAYDGKVLSVYFTEFVMQAPS